MAHCVAAYLLRPREVDEVSLERVVELLSIFKQTLKLLEIRDDYFDDVIVLFPVNVLMSERLRDTTDPLIPLIDVSGTIALGMVSILFGTIAILAFDFLSGYIKEVCTSVDDVMDASHKLRGSTRGYSLLHQGHAQKRQNYQCHLVPHHCIRSENISVHSRA